MPMKKIDATHDTVARDASGNDFVMSPNARFVVMITEVRS